MVTVQTDWNETSLRKIKEKGEAATGNNKYIASKVFAERAGWDFVATNKDSISFDLVTVLPALSFGPVLLKVCLLHKAQCWVL